MSKEIIQYVPFSSCVDPGFWHKLTQVKLDVDKLNERRKHIWGSYCYRPNTCPIFEINATSFNSSPDIAKYTETAHGILHNRNTIEDFKNCDKVQLLNDEGRLLWTDIQSGLCIDCPNLLSRFVLFSFADLKKYLYYYWFSFPAPSQPIVFVGQRSSPISEHFTNEQLQMLKSSYELLDEKQKAYFVLNVTESSIEAHPLAHVLCKVNKDGNPKNVDLECLHFGFIDPSNNENPGWPLRNYVALITYFCPMLRGKNVNLLSLRIKQSGDLKMSLIFKIHIPEDVGDKWDEGWVGWERNDKGNFGPRLSNMASTMDPKKLAETSADLNLKLMKWRLLPDLNLEVINNTKCLLLGAGTLGCAVARNLMAWGVRYITFIDNGKVSFSNPVRQNLFNHEDCLDGGKQKSLAAADNLKKIFPGVKSNGLSLHIPMPGHPVGESLKEQTLKDIHLLRSVFDAHNVIFLLLDSREARWLPTLLAASNGKLVINAALGFDSYVVMRHGRVRQFENIDIENLTLDYSNTPNDRLNSHVIPGYDLGCYFCNDVTAPGDSQRDRTLDQQCTVTRPGVSNIAAALAVELMISITQHQLGSDAPALYNTTVDVSTETIEHLDGILGPVPHSIRGFLTTYQHVLPSSAKFKQCIACSDMVIKLYKEEGVDFLMKAFESAKYLEDITGLTELHREADTADMWALSDSEEELL